MKLSNGPRAIALARLATTLLLCAGLHAQKSLVVDATNGPYRTIQAAVNASAAGDRVLIKAGFYESFQVAGKGISIVADAGTVIRFGLTTTSMQPIRIENVPSGQSCSISGLSIDYWFAFSAPYPFFEAKSCKGTVLLDGYTMPAKPSGLSWGSMHAIDVTDCAAVSLRGVSTYTPVVLRRSPTTITDSHLRSTAVWSGALTAEHCEVQVADSVIEGAQLYHGTSAHAIKASGAVITLCKGAKVIPLGSTSYPMVVTSAPSTLTADSTVGTIVTTAGWTVVTKNIFTLSVAPSRLGSKSAIDVQGTGGAFAPVFLSAPASPQSFLGIAGSAWILAPAIFLGAPILGTTTGRATLTLLHSNDSRYRGVQLAYQAIEVTNTGFALSNPVLHVFQ
ncbi:MAG: hypothetical protein H6832_18565 [Planctomycetes bacterium]|nr:hypothetical protein [Planctomycetota bacterium]